MYRSFDGVVTYKVCQIVLWIQLIHFLQSFSVCLCSACLWTFIFAMIIIDHIWSYQTITAKAKSHTMTSFLLKVIVQDQKIHK